MCLSVVFQAQAETAAQGNNMEQANDNVGPVMTVQEVMQLGDNSKVMLMGVIEKNLGNEKYLFKDGSGEIIIVVSEDDWNGVAGQIGNMVEVMGEVNKNDNGMMEIEVDNISVQPQ